MIAFILMTVILHVSNNSHLHRFTGFCAGALVATYITVEAPISGMSMNPARTFASAVAGNHWTALWVYFTAPLIGMLAAAEVFFAQQRISSGRLRQTTPRQRHALYILRQTGHSSQMER